MIDIQDSLFKDLEAVRQIPIVPTMLKIVCQTTEMGFAAIARVTDSRWLACSVRDELAFGLKEGGELKLETTLCNEVKDCRKPIVIDHADQDPQYKNHHTPKIYGLQSYISVPIILKDGTFFGTLCAIDSKPAKVNNPKVIGTLSMFAELLAFHLQSQDLLDRSYQANKELHNRNRVLTRVNHDLDTFVYTASHDLKSPVYNIEGLVKALSDAIDRETLDRQKVKQLIDLTKSSLRRLGATIKDLTTIVEADMNTEPENAEVLNIYEMVEDVKLDLHHLMVESKAKIAVSSEGNPVINFSRKNFKSILYNLLSNAIKYRSAERPPEVMVKVTNPDGKIRLSVSDNGTGIPPDKRDKVFTLFKRFHEHVEGSGIGLYIVKRMVDNAKGRIKVDSTLGKGTTFTIILG